MSIRVVCTGCMKSFDVSDKFAGRSGKCPNCKGDITIPKKEDEVVVHGGEDFGPEDGAGRPVLKPIERTDAKVSPIITTVIVLAVILVFALAFVFRGMSENGPPLIVLILGALGLGPALAMGGYSFLRDQELEPYRGKELWIRSLLCGLGYAAVWGAFAYLKWYLFEGELESFHLAFLVPAMVALGGGVALISLDMEYISGAIHFGFFLIVTVLLRWIMGLGPF